MHSNAETIHRFYEAFAAGDHATMAACYSDDATFSDPVFPKLDASEVRDMWRMFCTSDNHPEVSHSGVVATDAAGSAEWEARYAFPKTGRQVHNKIHASFEFADGLIVRHEDDFSFYRWTRMALGVPGVLFGWIPFMQETIRKQAAYQLRNFRSRNN